MHISVGQKVEVKILKLSQGGDGIARFKTGKSSEPGDFVIFVPYALPGEILHVEIVERRKNFARGIIRQMIRPHPLRVVPRCPYFFNPINKEMFRPRYSAYQGRLFLDPQSVRWCGGCGCQEMNYKMQLKEKRRIFKDTLQKIGGIPSDVILPAIGMNGGAEWRYRNKIQIPFGVDKRSQKIIAGFYAPSSHEIVPIDDCWIHSEKMMEVVRFVRGKMAEWNLKAYAEDRHDGFLRHLFIREEKSSGKLIVVFVTAQEFFPRQEEWIKELREKFPQIIGLFQNINPERTNVILGRKWRKLWGEDFLTETLEGLGKKGHDLKLKVSAGSFFQVNSTMAKALYQTARDFAIEGIEQEEKLILDLYCGVGGAGLACAPHASKVIGVEENPASIRDATENKRMNRAENCEFHCADVKNFLGKFSYLNYSVMTTVVILDPPRSGCEHEALKKIIELFPQRVVYISCDPATLARDLKILCAEKYQVKKIQPIDLFPQTAHLESVSLVERR